MVNGINSGLATLQKTTQPIKSVWSSASTQASEISEHAHHLYQRRHEFAPEIIGGSAVVGGGIAALRRGRVAGVLGAAVSGALAYGVVYDELKFDQVPEMISSLRKKFE